jgi:hypothetical protein
LAEALLRPRAQDLELAIKATSIHQLADQRAEGRPISVNR